LERPGWFPIVVSGAVPHGTSDALAMVIASFESIGSTKQVFLGYGTWLLFFTIALVSVLASRSDTARKLREELALIAYGGSSWQVWLRYFVRGLACTLLASTPLFYTEYFRADLSLVLIIVSAVIASTVGGFFYAAPSLARIRSREFVENYKG
jgi:hypothetical protein